MFLFGKGRNVEKYTSDDEIYEVVRFCEQIGIEKGVSIRIGVYPPKELNG